MADHPNKTASQDKNQNPSDNTLKHCGPWLESTLIKKADWANLIFAGLLAGETLSLVTIALYLITSLFVRNGSLWERGLMAIQALLPHFVLVIFAALLSITAAAVAKFAEVQWSQNWGKRLAAVALLPIAPLIFALYLQPVIFIVAPLLSLLTLWFLGNMWWQLFTFYLKQLVNWNHSKVLDEMQLRPAEVDLVTEHRRYLDLKKATLLARELRRQDQSSPSIHSRPSLMDNRARKLPTGQKYHRWGLALLIAAIVLGFSLLKPNVNNSHSQPQDNPALAGAKPTALQFWYQLDPMEAVLVDELSEAYAMEKITIRTRNSLGPLPLRLQQAFLSGDAPDIMLLPEDVAKELYTIGGESLVYRPLWPQEPWKQRLVLMSSPTTNMLNEVQDFINYLEAMLAPNP